MVRDVIIPTFHNRIPHRDWNPILMAFETRDQHPILVIGQDGDDILRACPASRETDLVFDAHPVSDFWTSLFAGAQAVDGAAYILNADTAPGAQHLMLTRDLWTKLEFELREFLFLATPAIKTTSDQSLWLINRAAMKIIRDANVEQLPELVPGWIVADGTLAETDLDSAPLAKAE